jgi:hypothetical protein
MTLKSRSRDANLPDSNWRELIQRVISLKRPSDAPRSTWLSVSATGSFSCASVLVSDRYRVPGASCASNQ